MAATSLEMPRHWSATSYAPLNTRPLDPTAGAKYKVLFSSPMGNGRRITASQNSTGRALFAVPWVDAIRFELDSLGYSTYIYGQKYLKRHLPLHHGDPAQQSLFLDSLETVAYTNFSKAYHEAIASNTTEAPYSKGWPKTEMIAYKGDFSQRSYAIKKDEDVSAAAVPELKRYLTRFPETQSFHRKVPGWGTAFDSDLLHHCQTLGSLPEFQQRWIYTSYFWPIGLPFADGGEAWDAGCSIPLDYIARTLGTVNDAAFDVDMKFTNDAGSIVSGFPTEELLFEDFRLSQPYYGANDCLYCDLMFIFVWNPKNWNKQLNPNRDATLTTGSYPYGMEYVQFVDKANASFSPVKRAYVKRNFNKLFWPRGAS